MLDNFQAGWVWRAIEGHPKMDGVGDGLGAQAIRRSFPPAIVVPGSFIALTDLHHYVRITEAVYRISSNADGCP
ncbi:MAG: hypothetical protein VX589_15500 [Myxococcota bacterium]|nr:hypothetical protein [Myxococcota bacterium]